MSAAKPDGGEAPRRAGHDVFVYDGRRLSRAIGLVGIARSGTTLLCSVLGVHSRIHAVYEPFNANKKRELPPAIGIDRFFAEFPTEVGGKDILLVKETGTQLAFLDRTAELLRSAAPPLQSDLIVLLRNPLHAFLSMLDARRKWWGGDHRASVETFQSWAAHNLRVLRRLLQLAGEFNALVVSYERLVLDKERLIPQLMDRLELGFEERQLSFEKYVERGQVRGDVALATSPSPISDERARQRNSQLALMQDRIDTAPAYPVVSDAARILSAVQEVGIARAGDAVLRDALALLSDCLAAARPARNRTG